MSGTTDNNAVLEEFLVARTWLCKLVDEWCALVRADAPRAWSDAAYQEVLKASSAFGLVQDRFEERWPR